MTAVVGITAQNTQGVLSTGTVDPVLVLDQIEAVITDIGVDTIKIGTTWSRATMEAIAQGIRSLSVPIVFDPVMVTAANSMLADPGEVVDAAKSLLMPLATVVTPNIKEAQLLTGFHDSAGRELAEAVVACGANAVVVTGGAVDTRGDAFFDGVDYCEIAVEWCEGGAIHGSGCAHSAALAAHLGFGYSLRESAVFAGRLASKAVARGSIFHLGSGPSPIDVFGIGDAR
jgi:hydroxymethylpyrimidine/phosphomethylpyrimidine kinase